MAGGWRYAVSGKQSCRSGHPSILRSFLPPPTAVAAAAVSIVVIMLLWHATCPTSMLQNPRAHPSAACQCMPMTVHQSAHTELEVAGRELQAQQVEADAEALATARAHAARLQAAADDSRVQYAALTTEVCMAYN